MRDPLTAEKGYVKYIYILMIIIVIAFSFFSFSEAFYPLLNSDSALNILMSHTYNFPKDIYCWGQDRGGTLIPLIGHFIYKIFSIHPIYACSLAHYIVLIAGFIFLSKMLKSGFSRLILAVVWFLPPALMVDYILYPFSTEFSLLAISFYYVDKIHKKEKVISSLRKNLIISFICIAAIGAVWVSDLSVVSIFLLLAFVLFYFIKVQTKPYSVKGSINRFLRTSSLYLIFFFFLTGSLFIFLGKLHAIKTTAYNENYLNNFTEIRQSIGIFVISFSEIFSFKVQDPYTGIYILTILLTLIVVIAGKKYYKQNKNSSFNWPLFFLINAVLNLVLLFLSHWAFLNGVSRRYFTVVYISLWLAFLFYADRKLIFKNKIISASLILVMICSLVSGTYLLNFPVRLKPAVELASEFKTLGKFGIISEYWNSYINACPDPDNIKVTPNDHDTYRNEKLIDEVFEQPKLYIIKDLWMDNFPDTLEQFGYTLVKKGSQFFIGGCYTCQYEKIKTHKKFYISDLKTNKVNISTDSVSGLQVLCADSVITNKNDAVEFGPFIHLGKGKFKVYFHLKTEKAGLNDTIAILDVSENYGTEILAKKYLTVNSFKNPGSFESAELFFETTKRLGSAEFRITYFGRRKLWLDYIELNEL